MDKEPSNSISVRPIPAGSTHALRHAVLRPHQTLEEMRYEGDDDAMAIHLGAFAPNHASKRGELVGVATLAPEPMPGPLIPGDWRLRGMAVDPGYQGQGIGRLLIDRAIVSVRAQSGTRIWCNARDTARGFYVKRCFALHGEPFEIVDIGKHWRMSITLDRS